MSEESVYNLVAVEQMAPEKPPLYRSTHKGTLPPTSSTLMTRGHSVGCRNAGGTSSNLNLKSGCKVWGTPLGTNLPQAANFLKQDPANRVESLSSLQRTNPSALKPTTLKPKAKPPLPGKDDKPIMGLCTAKNFIVANAVENILAAPKKPVVVSDDFTGKEDYGKVPPYLTKIKGDIEEEYQYIRTMRDMQEEAQRQTRPLNNEERQALIQGLKAKWETINSQYQLGTHLTSLDTVGKIQRKEKHETALAQIEKDIDKLKRENILIDTTA